MANRARGEATLTLEDGTVMTLAIDHNAMAEMEDAADGVTADELFQGMRRVKYMRAILFGALRQHHPEITLVQAGDLLSEGERVGVAIGEALERAFPQAFDEARKAVKEGEPHPPVRSAGTGMRSSPRGPKKI